MAFGSQSVESTQAWLHRVWKKGNVRLCDWQSFVGKSYGDSDGVGQNQVILHRCETSQRQHCEFRPRHRQFFFRTRIFIGKHPSAMLNQYSPC